MSIPTPGPSLPPDFRVDLSAAPALRREQTYRALRNAIQSGVLKPGTRLRETEVAERLGISRTPIREALGRLQSEGLVVNDPNRGMIVTVLDRQMIGELYVMRQVLEGTAAALAARHGSDEEISQLREIANRDRKLKDPQQLAANNRQFHEALYQAAHNRYLLKTLNTLRESLALLGATTMSVEGRSATAVREHQDIVAALERRDADAARDATVAHIKEAYRARLRVVGAGTAGG